MTIRLENKLFNSTSANPNFGMETIRITIILILIFILNIIQK
ncbi:hypothetical protein JCM19300_4224 [Algibacter lectus]|uniref:Uncharacterized protein n=1 Tax=Algibacter lectus TaxID=221126 RepID=A0A090VAX0_9FLAO|nr:hypothetical protein JCM19300_4224 [Algibacter lectus]